VLLNHNCLCIANFEARKFCFKFPAEFILSLWRITCQEYADVYLLKIQEAQTQVSRKLQEHKPGLLFTKFAICEHKQSDFLAVRLISTARLVTNISKFLQMQEEIS
jgi:hypothetical protein